MDNTEKFGQVVKYLIRRYEEESNIYAELDKKGDMINAANSRKCLCGLCPYR